MEALYGSEVHHVDWRRFWLCAALPWPLPSPQDLVEAWHVLVIDDSTTSRKMVTKEQFVAAEIWLDEFPAEEGMFDRNQALKEVRRIFFLNNWPHPLFTIDGSEF